jgi:hypothetical protein
LCGEQAHKSARKNCFRCCDEQQQRRRAGGSSCCSSKQASKQAAMSRLLISAPFFERDLNDQLCNETWQPACRTEVPAL